jgi:uncharacterized protein (DUF433 family)
MTYSTEIIDRGRGPEIRGTRITVYDVLDYHTKGRPPEEIAAVLKLSVEQVRAAINYIEKHREEVMPVYEDILRFSAEGNPPHIRAQLDGARERLMARKRELEQKRAAGGAGDARVTR